MTSLRTINRNGFTTQENIEYDLLTWRNRHYTKQAVSCKLGPEKWPTWYFADGAKTTYTGEDWRTTVEKVYTLYQKYGLQW